MVSGQDVLYGVDPWADKKNIVWKVQIKDIEHGVLHYEVNLNRRTNDSFRVSFCVIISFDGDSLIIQVNMGVPYLFYEL